jgi:hypothetical protein
VLPNNPVTIQHVDSLAVSVSCMNVSDDVTREAQQSDIGDEQSCRYLARIGVYLDRSAWSGSSPKRPVLFEFRVDLARLNFGPCWTGPRV